MNLTFSLGNFLTAIGIIGGLILLAYKIGQRIGEYTAAVNATLAKLTDAMAQVTGRVDQHDKEIGALMDVRGEAREDMMRIVREGGLGHQHREAAG